MTIDLSNIEMVMLNVMLPTWLCHTCHYVVYDFMDRAKGREAVGMM